MIDTINRSDFSLQEINGGKDKLKIIAELLGHCLSGFEAENRLLPKLVIRFREKKENKEVCEINPEIACEGFEPLCIDKALSADNIHPGVQREVGVGPLSKVVCLPKPGTGQVNRDKSKLPTAAEAAQ